MTYQREHRLDDRKLASIADELERSEPEIWVPGKQTRTELLDRIAALYRGPAAPAFTAGPGRSSTSVAKPGFHDFQALALRDVLSRLGDRLALREAALAAADPRVAKRVAMAAAGSARLVDPASGAWRDGQALWEAAQRRAVTLYRRANAAGGVSPRSSEVDAALAAIGSGAALPRDICQMLEPVFGVRLDRVRIHSGAVAQRACEAVNADAFTVGEDIFLPAWDPRSSACRELLAHELVHCVQWWQGRIGPSSGRSVSRPHDALEQEAERFVRGINFDRLDRAARGERPRRAQSVSALHPTQRSVASRAAAATAPIRVVDAAPNHNARTAPVHTVAAESVAASPSVAAWTPPAPVATAHGHWVMRLGKTDGPSSEPTETWDSANWQYWKDLAASMWNPPIGKILKQNATLVYENVWWVLGGLTLAIGIAYAAIVATGIVAATAAIVTWLTTWGLPVWAAEKKLAEWLEQVARVKGNEHEAAIAKERFAEVLVTIALLVARAKASKSAQADSRTATAQTERSGAAAPKQLESHAAAANADGAARQLPAHHVPARSNPVAATRGSNGRVQLPAIGATPSFIGPPTEQQLLDQQRFIYDLSSGERIGVTVDTKTNQRIALDTRSADLRNPPRPIGHLSFTIIDKDTISIDSYIINSEFRHQKTSDILFETLIQNHRPAIITAELHDTNIDAYHRSLSGQFRDRLELPEGDSLEGAQQFMASGISQLELQSATPQALEATPIAKSLRRLGYRLVAERSGLLPNGDGLLHYPKAVFGRADVTPTPASFGAARGVATGMVTANGDRALTAGRSSDQAWIPAMAGGSPGPGEFGQPSPNTEAVTALLKNASQIRIILDYDGTLVPLQDNPEACAPDAELVGIFERLAKHPKIKVMVNSGRPRKTLDKWVGHYPFAMAAEHGAWTRGAGADAQWRSGNLGTQWKSTVQGIMDKYVRHTPGSSIETKDFCLVWHYRVASEIELQPGAAKSQSAALIEELRPLCSSLGLEILDGNMVVEVKPKGINKGTAADEFVSSNPLVVHVVAGDDATDEHMFSVMPNDSITIKVGTAASGAKYRLANVGNVRSFLKQLIEDASPHASATSPNEFVPPTGRGTDAVVGAEPTPRP